MRQNEFVDSFGNHTPDNVLLFPFVSIENYTYSVSACDVALVSFREGLEGMVVPSKIYGILAAGVPVIAMVPEKSEIAYIVREENCGYVVEPGDVDGLINAIMELKSNKKLRQEMGINGRKAFEQKYTTKIIADKYKLLIKAL